MDFDPQEDNTSVPLEELFPPPAQTTGLPEGSVRDKATKLSLISSPVADPVGTYQTLMQEHYEGYDHTMQSIEGQVKAKQQKSDLAALTQVLSDPTLTIEQKDKALRYHNSQLMKPADINRELMIKEATKEPEKKNDPEVETKRFSISEKLDEIHNSAAQQQRAINGFMSDLDSSGGKGFLDVMESTFVPFANNKVAAQAVANLKKSGQPATPNSFLMTFSALGGTLDELNESYRNMPAAQQVEFVKALTQAYSGTSAIFGDSNDYAKFQQILSITSGQDYGGAEKFLDNVTPYLDAIGVGFLAKALKPAKKLPKAPRVEPNMGATTPDASRSPQKASESIFEPKVAPTPPIDTAGRQRALDDLFDQRASMLGDSSGLAARGDVRQMQGELDALKAPVFDKGRVKEIQQQGVSYKDALKQAEKEHSDLMADYTATKQRLESMMDANRSAAKNEQNLADIDAKIAKLEAEIQATPGFQQKSLVEAMSQIQWNFVKGVNNPSSAGRLMGSVNEDTARTLHATVLNAPDDEFSVAMFGAKKVDTIANDILTEVANKGAKVPAKPFDIERALRNELPLDEDVIKASRLSEGLGITKGERAAMYAAAQRDFETATGLTPHVSMSSFGKNPSNGNFVYSAVYGHSDGAWSNAVDAVQQSAFALRKYGVTEKDITILQRRGNEFVPVNKGNIPDGPGEYYVRVDGEHSFDLTDVGTPEVLDVKRNFFDKINIFNWGNKGSLNRYVFDIDSTLHKELTTAASNADDKSALLDRLMLDMANDAAELYRKMPEASRKRVDEFMLESNVQGIKTTDANMIARGLDATERAVVKKWRKFWDNHYFLENYDLVRTLNRDGYEILDNGSDKFFAKQVKSINAVPTSVTRVYDSVIGDVVDITRSEMANIYSNNGYMAKLRRPEVINGELVEYMKIRNTPTEYLRKVNQNDSVLNYRDGYFQIIYKAPKFVDEIVTDASGNKIRRAIAVAGDSLEAEQFANRMRSTNANAEYVVRGDKRLFLRDTDEYWDLNSVTGRIAQRHRGKTLEDASGMNHLGDHNFIMDPAEASIRSARSISGRTMMRPVLENMKARFIHQYKHLLIPDATGTYRFPSNVNGITETGIYSRKDLADARTTWEAINYWENGYINSMDQALKATWNMIGEALAPLAAKGSKTAAFGERLASQASEGAGITGWMKSSVFTAYIGTNPLRQWIVQPSQVIRLTSYSGPRYVIDAIKGAANVFEERALGIKASDPGLYKFIEETGMLDAVDKSNLVRGALVDAAESSNKIKRLGAKALNVPRKIGFDAAEQFNLVAHLSAVYKKYERSGANLNDFDVRQAMQKEARALSFGMNRANDMIYNQGMASALLQFLQIPHKAFLQYTNRSIPASVRRRLAVGDTLIYGPPTALVSAMYNYDWMPEDKKLAEVVKDGALSAVMNNLFVNIIPGDGEQKKLDIRGSVDPYNIDGWVKFYTAIGEEGGISAAIANSPAGSFWWKDGGKISNAMSTAMRLFQPIDPEETTPDKLIALAKDVARISSGFDNAYKATIMLDIGKRVNAMGKTVADQATTLDAIAQIFGFGAYEPAALIKESMKLSKDEKKMKEEADKQYKEFKRYITTKYAEGDTDINWHTSVTGWIISTYKDNPAMERYIFQQYKRDLQDPTSGFAKQILRMSGHPDFDTFKSSVMNSGLTDEQKKEQIDNWIHLNTLRESEE